MSFFVYSTLTNTTNYAIYRPQAQDNNGTPIIDRKISILGGSNVMPMPRDGMLLPQGGVVTPRGIVTEISDEDMAYLETDFHFKEHVKHGFIHVEKKAVASEKVVKDMEAKDESAPKTPEDFVKVEKEDASAPTYKAKDSKRK